MIQVTIKGNTSNSYAMGTAKTVSVLGIHPNLTTINQADETIGGVKEKAPGGRYTYTVTCYPFSVDSTAAAGSVQDFGDLVTLQEILAYNRYLWIYAVSGASRVDANDVDFWSTHDLPAAITLVGDARSALDFTGNVNYEFEIEARGVRFS